MVTYDSLKDLYVPGVNGSKGNWLNNVGKSEKAGAELEKRRSDGWLERVSKANE